MTNDDGPFQCVKCLTWFIDIDDVTAHVITCRKVTLGMPKLVANKGVLRG